MSETLPILPEEVLVNMDASRDKEGFGSLFTERGALPLTVMDIQATLEDLLAQVELAQTFVNNHDVALEATYIFPLPAGAAVTAFRMDVGDRVINGLLKERGQARAEYQQAVQKGQRAAIMEEDRPGVFTIRVGNIMPGEQARVRLTLHGPLAFDNGEVTFRFPLVVAPRYIPGKPLDGEPVGLGIANDTDAVPDASRISPPVLLPGYPNPVRLSLEVNVDPTMILPRDFRSSLHTILIQQDVTGHCQIRLQPHERLNRDFVLRYALSTEAIVSSATVMPDPHSNNEGTWQVTVLPPQDVNKSQAPRDIVFLVDRSGSMGNWKMVAARRAVADLVLGLTDKDRFQVLAFDDQIETPPLFSAKQLIPATSANRYAVQSYLGGLMARGGTVLAQPLMRALDLLREKGRERIVVVITDGQVGNEDQILRVLRQYGLDQRIFTLGIDQAVNETFLQRLAAMGGGSCDVVESETRLKEVMAKVHRRIGAPVVTELRLEWQNLAVDANSMSQQALALFPGVPLTIYGRYTGIETGKLKLHGTDQSGFPWSVELDVQKSQHPTMAVLWAKQRLRHLEDQFVVADLGRRAQLEKEIISLSLRYGILCRFTAFVAVDDHGVVNESGEVHQVVQAVEQPASWANAPVAAAAPMASVPATGGFWQDFDSARRSRKMRSAPLPAPSYSPSKNAADDDEDMLADMEFADSSTQEFAKPEAPGVFGWLKDKFSLRKEKRSVDNMIEGYRKRVEDIHKFWKENQSDNDVETLRKLLGVTRLRIQDLLADMKSTGLDEELQKPLKKCLVIIEQVLWDDQIGSNVLTETWKEIGEILEKYCAIKS